MSKFIKLLLVLLLANTVYSQSAEKCQLYVKTVPEGALIKCNGDLQEVSPTTIRDLPVGDYLISASMSGYKTIFQNVSFDAAGQRAAVELELEPLMGLVLIKSEPSGAEVEIGGKTYGTTPIILDSLRFGEYDVVLKKSGFEPQTVPLVINNRRPILLNKVLASDTATLSVNSTPDSANVLINGIPKGRTPCTITGVPKGDSRVEVRLDAYKPFSTTVVLAPNQEETIEVELEPLPSSLEIITFPTEARVYIDGRFKGIAPVRLLDIDPGSYSVKAELDGYEALEKTVVVKQGEDNKEEFSLESNTGILEIITAPAGVSVMVDDKSYGITKAGQDGSEDISAPLQISGIVAGEHVVTFTKSKFFSASQSTVIEKGQKTKIQKNLKRKFEPDCALVTVDGISYKGEFVETTPGGGKMLETAPGIFKTFEAQDIRSFELLENFEIQ